MGAMGIPACRDLFLVVAVLSGDGILFLSLAGPSKREILVHIEAVGTRGLDRTGVCFDRCGCLAIVDGGMLYSFTVVVCRSGDLGGDHGECGALAAVE